MDEKEEQQLPTVDDLVSTFIDVSEEAISVRIDPEAMTNATVHALHFADLINAIDIAYADAFDRKPMKMSGMQMDGGIDKMKMSGMQMDGGIDKMKMSGMQMDGGIDKMKMSGMQMDGGIDKMKMSGMQMDGGIDKMKMSGMQMDGGIDKMKMSGMQMDGGIDKMKMSGMQMDGGIDKMKMSGMQMDGGIDKMKMSGMQMDGEGNSSSISNLGSYQTGKELTNTAINLFNSTIKQNAPDNATERINTIEGGLVQLKKIIEAKNQYDDAMGIIHGIIHTKTQDTFNLPLKIN